MSDDSRPNEEGASKEAEESRPELSEGMRGWLLLYGMAMEIAHAQVRAEEAESRREYRAWKREERRRLRAPQPAEINLRRLRNHAQALDDDAQAIADSLAELKEQLAFLRHDTAVLARWLRWHGAEEGEPE